MKAKILAQYYADAGKFVTREQSRYSLDTLRIEQHPERGVVIVATDGHSLCLFHDLGGECPADGVTLRYRGSLADMCFPERMLEVNDDGSASVLWQTKEEVRFSDIESDGKFPNWRAILPQWKKEVSRTDYNPEYIERCASLCGAHYPHLAIWSGAEIPQLPGQDGPSVIRPYERDDCFFLVMPMRRSDDVRWPELIDLFRAKGEPDAVETESTNGN